jgi:hypothetical protein
MKLVAWKTVRSREGRPDEFYISFGKKPIDKNHPPSFLFNCREEDAKKAFGEEISKITGLCVIHPINLALSMRVVEDET